MSIRSLPNVNRSVGLADRGRSRASGMRRAAMGHGRLRLRFHLHGGRGRRLLCRRARGGVPGVSAARRPPAGLGSGTCRSWLDSKFLQSRDDPPVNENEYTDEDVAAERARIMGNR